MSLDSARDCADFAGHIMETDAADDAITTDTVHPLEVDMNQLGLDAVAVAATTQPPHTPNNLAPELKLQIASNLSMAQVMKLRQMSLKFKELVDEHQDTIAQSRIKSSLAYIDDFIKSHITYSAKNVNGKSAFMTALTAFINLRGVVKPSLCFEWMELIEWFIATWKIRLTLENESEKDEVPAEDSEEIESQQPDMNDEAEHREHKMDPLQVAIFNLARLHAHYHVRGCDLEEESVIFYQDKWLAIPPKIVGLQSVVQMHVVLQDIEAGAWIPAKVFQQCPVLSCEVDAPPTPYGIYADPFWDAIEEDNKRAKAEKLAREELERAAIADAAAGWTLVAKPPRRSKKQVAKTSAALDPQNLAPSKPVTEYPEGMPDPDKESYDEFNDRPIFCPEYGIYYEQEDSEALASKFQRIFGVSDLLEGTPFRHFVKSKWAYEMVVEVLSGQIEPSLQQKAAILEDLYIY